MFEECIYSPSYSTLDFSSTQVPIFKKTRMKEVILSGATGLQSETLLKMNAFTRIFRVLAIEF